MSRTVTLIEPSSLHTHAGYGARSPTPIILSSLSPSLPHPSSEMTPSPSASLSLPHVRLRLLPFITAVIFLQADAAHSLSFVFNGFNTNSNLSLAGVAAIERGFVRLTNSSRHSFGRAFYPVPIRMKDPSTMAVFSFSSTFVFCTTPMVPTVGGHGFAFVLSRTLDTAGAFTAQFLGLLNTSNDGNSSNHVFAVEFDTIQDLDVNDIDDNHVGINLNSMISAHSATAGYWTQSQNSTLTKTRITLRAGDVIQAWVDYDGQKQLLNVTICPVGKPRPQFPLLSVNVSLADILEEHTYVGFSAATGIVWGTHRLLSWSFNSNGVAKSLNMSLLPSVFLPKIPVKNIKLRLLVSVAVLFILGFLAGLLAYIIRQREIIEGWELEFGLNRFSYKQLVTATRKFHEKELLGVGGFGCVYRGVMPNSALEVAVKRLSRDSNQGEREFIAEMAIMGRLQHPNLTQLLGWSRCKGELLLVYEYMPNGSLDRLLFGRPSQALRWEQRQKVLKGIAAGVLYLHEGWEQQILHRDIKASNVLLDMDMNAKLGDFGLARLYEHGKSPHTTRIVGTLGYLAPEFVRTGKATTSTDVYSFGVLLLEVVTGRHAVDTSGAIALEYLLVDSVWSLYRNGKLLEAVDKKLDGFWNSEEAEKMLVLGLLCTHPNPASRPEMGEVVQILCSNAPIPHLPPVLAPAPSQARFKEDGELLSFSSSSCAMPWEPEDHQITEISGR